MRPSPTHSSAVNSLARPARAHLFFFLLSCSLAFLGTDLHAATSRQGVQKWRNLGPYSIPLSGGGTETGTLVEVTKGVMEQGGSVTPSYTNTMQLKNGVFPKALAFAAAASDKWFIETSWSPIITPTPPPPGFSVSRGFQVTQTFPHDYGNWRYELVEPVSPGGLRFELEPQDVSCKLNEGFELSVFVVAPLGTLYVRWFRIDAAGVVTPLGIAGQELIGNNDFHYGVLHSSNLGSSYYVEISDGSKTIKSRPAKVLPRGAGNEDLVDPASGTATIRGKVWDDDNNNDVDDSEPGLPGIEVSLVDIDANKQVIARAVTDRFGNYAFLSVKPNNEGYRVRWHFGEQYHVARPNIGGNTSVDCDAVFASSLIDAPTSGPISQDSGIILPTNSQTINDVDLGLFEKPKLTFVESGNVAIEGDSDIAIQITYQLSKPLRYTPLTLYFRTWSFPKDGATRLVDFRQDNVTSTTIPAGTTTGTLQFTIIGDNLTEGIEHFFIEPDQFANNSHIKRVEKPSVYRVSIVDDDVKLPDPSDQFREYKTEFGNRILTGGTADFSTGEPLFWEEAPELSTNGKPSFKVGPANGLIANAVLTAPDAKGPRTVSFEWRFSGSSEDLMTIITQDLSVQYDINNVPPILAQHNGVAGWQPVSITVPPNHVININIGKGSFETNSIQGWIRNLELGGPDSPNASPQPEALAITGLEEIQKPTEDDERALGIPSQNSNGSYATTVETDAGSADQAGSVSNFAVSTKGAVSGKAFVAGKPVSVRGNLDSNGKFFTSLHSKSGDTADLFLQMQTELKTGAVELVGSIHDSAGNSGDITSQKPVKWVNKIDPCPFAGRYNLILPQRANGAPHLPTGEGFASIVISTTGKVKISGVLGDGTPFTAASSVTPSGRIPFQKRLYKNQGSLSGALQIRDVPNISDIDGKLRWVKPADPRAKLHKDGFDVEITSLGSFFFPTQRPPFSTLSGPGPWEVEVEFSGGDDIKEAVSLTTNLSIKGSSAILHEPAPPQGLKAYFLVRGKASLSTGLVSFTYENKGLKKKVSCRGLIFQKQNTMSGFMTGKLATGSFVVQ